MRLCSRAHGVGSDLNGAAGAVLETDRHREPRRQFTVHLALGRARPDRAPRDQVGHELRCDRIQELERRRQAQLDHVAQERARNAQPGIDREAAVELGVVDQALPADGGARLFEIRAHHQLQVTLELGQQRL